MKKIGNNMEIKIGSLFNIPLFFHFSTLLIPLLLIRDFKFLIVFVIIYIGIIAHELGHALMARKFGFPSQRITILPIGCVVSIDFSRKSMLKYQEFFIALAGPMVTLCTIGIFYFVRHVPIFDVVYKFSWIIFIFNIIPMFPLDGGRIIRSLLEFKCSRLMATTIAVYTSYVLLLGFTIYSIINFSIFNLLIIAFLAYNARQELKIERYKCRGITQNYFKKAKLNTTNSRLKHIRGE